LLSRICGAALLGLVLACGDDEADFLEPGPGDFVQLVQPDNGETLSAEEFRRRPVSIVLNFFPAEGFGFGSLRSFRYDGDDVTDEVQVILEDPSPAFRASLSFVPDDDPGQHTVEVTYTDSRGTIHRVRWSFTVVG
jgi:hypothetical protein